MRSDLFKYSIYFLLAAFFVLLVQLYFPKPINWKRNFNTQSKDPYGLYVFDKELPKLLNNQNIKKTAQSPYEFIHQEPSLANQTTTFLLIENSKHHDKNSVDVLLEKVKEGSDLVIASESYFPTELLKSLQLKKINVYKRNFHFVHPQFAKDTLSIRDNYHNAFLTKNPKNHQIIGKLDNELSFISTKYGKGTVYLSSTPILLTNYYLLNDNEHFSSFTEGFAAILKNKNIVWFDVNHPGYVADEQSILRVMFQHKSLRFAWYTLLFGLILYIIFYGKRKQRIVPIIEPLKNTTVEYVETIGNLYYQENDHTALLNKQIKFVLHHIRSNWHLPTHNLDDVFKLKLQQKTQADIKEINEFVAFIEQFNPDKKYTQGELLSFNQLLEKLNINYGTVRK